ncbi:two-component system response regulator [Steroidobacter agaridevorans]|uniref:Two-component system response regulator n=1 Tax=Steroidobacter agaridevorans TaxID=2695856 RepID=A0A829YCK1_9GAMM|nr:ANTAR domain-containing protein [Steroidobacter agaridevorans]GFE81000.1 two-component system response regulator [Steroidobacter agaridevorans]GFE89116.1 two-component system response regulator [Steroidobacter agaridevorans]
MRVLVVAESADGAEILKSGVRLGGHELTEVLPLDSALLPALERGKPDVLLLEARSPSLDLLDRLLDAMGSTAMPFAVFAGGDASSQAIENGVRAGAAAYVVDGLEAARVPAILQVALARFDFISGLRSELGLAQQKLAERKFVERAKGLLMKARNLSEDEAYHTLRRMAMERNRRMGDVAKSVIEMAELLN